MLTILLNSLKYHLVANTATFLLPGLGCECLPNTIVEHDTGHYGAPDAGAATGGLLGLLQCKACPRGKTPTRERDRCIGCPQGRAGCKCKEGEVRGEDGIGNSSDEDKTVINGRTNSCICSLPVERDRDGTPLETIRCTQCSPGYEASHDTTRCQPCQKPPIIQGQRQACNCSVSAGVCLPTNLVRRVT